MRTDAYPTHRSVSVAEARTADLAASAEYSIPSLVLMEHAGLGLARLAFALPCGTGPVAILCGPGNNGGDGYACARFLASFGVPIRVVRCGSAPPRGDAAVEHALTSRDAPVGVAASAADAPVVEAALSGASVVVDALFGVGLSRALEPPYPEWIERVNAARALRLSADVPSGLDADEGRPLPVAVRADVTAAMGLPKRGCFVNEGPSFAGRVVEVDVGLPREVHGPYLA